MRRPLQLHPDSVDIAVTAVTVDVTHPQPGGLAFAYSVTGTIRDLRIPARHAPVRTDELWKHTCFEAFIGASSGAGYYEFNFSPSTQWAAYEFAGYRNGMRVATAIPAPPITVDSEAGRFTLLTSLELDRIELPRRGKWRLGLSAVIEDRNGQKSYWALAHPPGKPDFHRADCFLHEFS